MTKAERTRQFIVERTAPLFNTKGYDGTSLSDLTAATGLTKGAIYGNFQDKETLAAQAFHYAIKKVKKMVAKEVSGLRSYKSQLIAVLEFFARYVHNPPIDGGCPLLNTAIEADDHRLSMRRRVASELNKTVGFIAGLIEKGIEAGEFSKRAEPRKLAYVFFCSIEGALMFSRVERSNEPMQIIVEHVKKIIDQISKS